MSGIIPQRPLYAFMALTGTHLHFLRLKFFHNVKI